MAIVNFFETGTTLGTINTEATFTPITSKSLQHNFPAPGVDVWSRAYLQGVNINASDGDAGLWISQFVNNTGVHNGKFRPGIFSKSCTSVSANMFTRDCIATFIFTSEIFG
jgi:hypothetical protein